MFGYAQLLLPDSVAAAEVVDSVLEAAAERDAVRDEAGARPSAGDGAPAGDNLRALMYAAVRRECRKRRLVSGWASYASEPEVLPAKTGVGGLGAENIGVASISAVQRYLQAAAMTQVLAGLPERQREMLNLAFWHGLSPDELGTIFAIPVRLAEKELASACARFASLVAVVVLLQSGRSDCPDLDRIIVGSFAETPGYELCREVGTHSLECAICSDTVASRGLGPLRVEDLPSVDLNPDLDRQLASFAQSLDPAPRTRVPLWGGEGRASARSGAARLGQSLLRRLDPPADGKPPSPPAWQGRARLLGAAASALAVVGIVAGVMVLGKFTITPATEADGSSAVQLSGAPSGSGGAPGSGQAGQFQVQRPGAPNSTLPIFTSPGPPSTSSSPPIGTQPSSPAPTPSGSSPTRHTKSPKPSRSPTPPPPPPTSPPPFSTSPTPTSSSPSPDPSSTAPAPAQSAAPATAQSSVAGAPATSSPS